MIDLGSVKLFQRHLQIGLRAFAVIVVEDWHKLFSGKLNYCHARGSTLCLINTRLQVSGDQRVVFSLSDLLLVDGLPFRAPA